MSTSRKPLVIGWREWVGLPDFGIPSIKAKVDTGARTSSLHADDVEEFERKGLTYVRFKVHPEQRTRREEIAVEALLKDRRYVRPSTGKRELRPVVVTTIQLLEQRFAIELTLTSRDAMGFRMLLGRQAVRDRFVVDPGRSFLNGKRIKNSKRIKKKRPK